MPKRDRHEKRDRYGRRIKTNKEDDENEDEIVDEQLSLRDLQKEDAEESKKRKPFFSAGSDEEEEFDRDLEEEEEEEALREAIALAETTQIKKTFVNNKEALLQAIEEIKFKDFPWIETIDVTSNQALEQPGFDVNDDLKRELAIYDQALAAVKIAQAKFDQIGFKHRRPEDYFAEMLKSDEHMAKIRNKILMEKEQLESADTRRKEREAKKFGKKVQQAKLLERQETKKKQLDAVKQWRETKKQGGVDEFPIELATEAADSKPKGKNHPKSPNKQTQPHSSKANGFNKSKSKKRAIKDSKYGFGGPKRKSKQNDGESAADFSGFSKRRNKELPKAFLPPTLANRKGKKGVTKRPGKRQRQQKGKF